MWETVIFARREKCFFDIFENATTSTPNPIVHEITRSESLIIVFTEMQSNAKKGERLKRKINLLLSIKEA